MCSNANLDDEEHPAAKDRQTRVIAGGQLALKSFLPANTLVREIIKTLLERVKITTFMQS
eukprot:3045627-Rhodomonas_salina.2